jgi:hypothetical protein
VTTSTVPSSFSMVPRTRMVCCWAEADEIAATA